MNPRTFSVLAGDQVTDDGLAWIEVMPTADKARNGPWYFTVTREDLDTAATSIKENATRIPIDYDHPEQGDSTRAAGWFTGEAKVVDAGDQNPRGEVAAHASLWAEVKWTPTGAEEVKNGDFRFLSPEWQFEHKDKKTGLLTRFKELIAATLTNRPFFTELAPVTATVAAGLADVITAIGEGDKAKLEQACVQLREVKPGRPGVEALAEAVKAATADGQTVTLDPDDVVVLQAMDDLLDEILGEPEPEDAAQAKALDALVRAAQWTTAYINDLPDSAFLYVQGGGSKDSDGKTTPRSLRHFPVRDASGTVDQPHVRDALSRIPQSNVPAAAKTKATNAAQRLLKNQKNTTSKEEENMDSEALKALGLDEDASSEEILIAVTDLKEKVAITESFDKSVLEQLTKVTAKELETERQLAKLHRETLKDREERDREDALAKAVELGKILPVHKNALRAVHAVNRDAFKEMLEASPSRSFAAVGSGELGPEDRPEPRTITDQRGNAVASVEDHEWLARAAQQVLLEKGKTVKACTRDEYLDALEIARDRAAR